MHIAVVARMLFRAPMVGLRAFLLALPWVVPVYIGILYAGKSVELAAFADVNAAFAAVVDSMLVGNTEWRVPAWVDPFGWLPLLGAAIVWLYFAQRAAMRLTGAGRSIPGPITLVRNFIEWTANALLLPLIGVTMFVGGFLIMTVHEIAWPWHLPSAPSMPATFGTPLEDFGRELLNTYIGVPLALLFLCISPLLLGARYMSLQAAFSEGSNEGGSTPRLLLLLCSLISLALFYPVAAGVMWFLAALGTGYVVTLGDVWLLHFALMWCSLSAAAGFAAREEVVRSIEEAIEAARRDDTTPIGTIAAETYDDDQGDGDELMRRLRAFQSRQAA